MMAKHLIAATTITVATLLLRPLTESVQAQDAATLYQRCDAFMAQKQFDQAAATCQSAIAADPSQATATQLGNLCFILYNQGKMDRVIPACDRAIAADPNRADLYFVKGSALFGDSTMSGNKFIAPPAAIEALNKYLQLAPNGSHADDANAMLDATQ